MIIINGTLYYIPIPIYLIIVTKWRFQATAIIPVT